MAETYGGTPRGDLENSDFVLAKERKFPVKTAQDVKDAVSSWGRYKGDATFDEFKAALIRLAKRKGLEDALPEAWAVKKSLESLLDDCTAAADVLAEIADLELLPAIKAGRRHSAADEALVQAVHDAARDICELAMALGAECDDEEDDEDDDDEDADEDMSAEEDDLSDEEDDDDEPMAAKSLDLHGDRIGGYGILFGSPGQHDLSPWKDYFTRDTNFWLDQTGPKRPMAYHHGLDDATKAMPIVGVWDTARVDDVGVWFEGQINRSHKYSAAIKELVSRGLLKLSSDSVPHFVQRERQRNGSHRVVSWPLFGVSLTTEPAEPRMLPLSEVKSLYAAAGVAAPGALGNSQDEPEPEDDEAQLGAGVAAKALMADIDCLLLEAQALCL